MTLIDAAFYGAVGSAQPTGTPDPQPDPAGATRVRTEPRIGQGGIVHNPVFWLVALVASALGLVHLSIRWSS
jgi:hypothetical protein